MSNNPTICEDCKHHFRSDECGDRCKALRHEYVDNRYYSFGVCKIINDKGKCPLFEPKTPLWRRIAAWVKGGTA